MMRRMCYMALLMLSLLAFTGCYEKELCVLHPHSRNLLVRFDWRDAPEADPESMVVYFYPMDEGGEVQYFEFLYGREDSISLTEGRYRVLCYNNDTEGVQARNTHSFDTHEAYTREGNIFETVLGPQGQYAPRAAGREGERVVITPDQMWGCVTLDVEVTADGITYLPVPPSRGDEFHVRERASAIEDSRTFILYPHTLVCNYSYEIRNVKNMHTILRQCASLSGMAPSLMLAPDQLRMEAVTLPAPAEKDGESTVRGRFLTFGHHPDLEEPHFLVLYLWLKDGQMLYYQKDVTEQVNTAPDKRNVHIVVDGPDLPLPITNGNGFSTSVDDWETVNETIEM